MKKGKKVKFKGFGGDVVIGSGGLVKNEVLVNFVVVVLVFLKRLIELFVFWVVGIVVGEFDLFVVFEYVEVDIGKGISFFVKSKCKLKLW